MGGAKGLNRKIMKLKRELKQERERFQMVLHNLEGLSPEKTRHCRQWFWLVIGSTVATLLGSADQDQATFQHNCAGWLAHFYYRLMHEGQPPESVEVLMAFLVEQGIDNLHNIAAALDEEWVSREMAQHEDREERD